jgi:hypothetical protein
LPETIMFSAGSRPSTRQALGAASARQQAQLHFRQRDLRARHGDAVVAAQRQFQAAAHAHGMDRRHHRLGRALGGGNQGVQAGLGQRLGGIEFFDVGAARKALPAPVMTMALTASSASACWMPFTAAVRVSRPMPLTGGLFR